MTWDDLPGPSTTEHLRQKGQGSQVGTSAQTGHKVTKLGQNPAVEAPEDMKAIE